MTLGHDGDNLDRDQKMQRHVGGTRFLLFGLDLEQFLRSSSSATFGQVDCSQDAGIRLPCRQQ